MAMCVFGQSGMCRLRKMMVTMVRNRGDAWESDVHYVLEQGNG